MSRKETSPAMKTIADLDAYRDWCIEYGYVFDEKDLYKQNSNWSFYQRSRHGDKSIRVNWDRDANREYRPAEATREYRPAHHRDFTKKS